MPDLSNINYIHKYLKIKIHGHLQHCGISINYYLYTFHIVIIFLIFPLKYFLLFSSTDLCFCDGSCAAAAGIEKVSKLNSYIDWGMPNGIHGAYSDVCPMVNIVHPCIHL